MRKRVNLAADIQRERYSKLKINFNGELDGRNVDEFCPLGKKESSMMEKAFDRLGLSARGYFKVLKVARTLADLEEKKNIECSHLAEALSLRTFS